MISGLVPISILGVVWTGEIHGLQTLCGMLAGQGLSLAVPMPSEPAGYLIVPVVLLYFGVISAAGWCVDGTLQLLEKRTPELADALSTVFEQYISLFATTRALAVFQVIHLPPPFSYRKGRLTVRASKGFGAAVYVMPSLYGVSLVAE